jgi:hypothetical protein
MYPMVKFGLPMQPDGVWMILRARLFQTLLPIVIMGRRRGNFLVPIGVLGTSQFFPEGRTDGIKIPTSPNFNLGSSFTASMWMKFEGRLPGQVPTMISSIIDSSVPKDTGINNWVLKS